MLKASVIIPTFNGAATLRQCLESVFNQETPWEFEVHAVDSGSTDGTLDIIADFPVHLTRIPPEDFNHGRTRNQVAHHASAEHVVFLVQDARPIGRDWLRTLVSAVETSGAAGAFGSQQPRPDASAFTRWAMSRVLPDSRTIKVKTIGPDRDWQAMAPHERYHLAFFHNANSCIRRQVLLQLPFRHRMYGEDMDWAKRALMAGHAIAYEPRAAVIHSHDRSVLYEFKRAYSDHSLVKELFDLVWIPSPGKLVRALVWHVFHASRSVWRSPSPAVRRVRNVADAALHAGAQVLGMYLGSRSSTLISRYSPMIRLDRRLRRGV